MCDRNQEFKCPEIAILDILTFWAHLFHEKYGATVKYDYQTELFSDSEVVKKRNTNQSGGHYKKSFILDG